MMMKDMDSIRWSKLWITEKKIDAKIAWSGNNALRYDLFNEIHIERLKFNFKILRIYGLV